MPREIKILEESELVDEVGVVVGTRPGIIMFAPIIKELSNRSVPNFVIHTGQHYSPNMDMNLFADLELREADYRIDGVADHKTHGGQTARMLEGVEKILLDRRPKMLLVGGDANTNLAGALAARKLRIQVGHVEAGERSYDWRMPEEHNRVVIDHISDHLFATGSVAIGNLQREGVRGRIHRTGNPIVDASLQHAEIARRKSNALERLGVTASGYSVVTMHREENVDDKSALVSALRGASEAAVQTGLRAMFFAHPRTLKRLMEFDLQQWARDLPGLALHEAVGYLDFLNLLAQARLVYTDSGGVQQEACIHNVPCVTLRDNTEWTETLDIGANRLAGCDPAKILEATHLALRSSRRWQSPFGDGTAARNIVDVVARELGSSTLGGSGLMAAR